MAGNARAVVAPGRRSALLACLPVSEGRPPAPKPAPISEPEPARQQVAVLPYRMGERLEIMLITSLKTRRWVLPKGWPLLGTALHESAACEAFEEAGLDGDVSSDALGTYHYFKRKKSGALHLCQVSVFAMQVRGQRRNWPEKEQRLTRWFSCHEAAEQVHEEELRVLIRAFATSSRSAVPVLPEEG